MTSIESGSVRVALRRAVGVVLAVCLLAVASAAHAASGAAPGFWDGFGDGFLSLLKLLASPIAVVTILDPEAWHWTYDAGYFLGVLGFAGIAGAAATSAEAEASRSL